ncbi:MAG: hypothetical protein V4857_01560 [Pseudomonadota bacterium]
MNKLLIATLAIILSGCATYKVEQTSVVGNKVSNIDDDATIKITTNGARTGGLHCFEPMLYVVTLGIIPQHCATDYSAAITTKTGQDAPIGNFRISTVNGWLALILAPQPEWRYGWPRSAESEIKQAISKK